MMRTSLTRAAVAAVGLLLVTTLAACAGVAPSPGESPAPAGSAEPGQAPGADEVRLVVSQGYGTTTTHDVVVAAEQDMTVMSLLAANTKLDTGYGGSFVTAIDGIESTFGATGDASDWFFWVDGRMGGTGAGDVDVKGGETVWWDYHEWQGAMFIPAALHAFPRPWSQGGAALVGTLAVDETSAMLESRGIAVARRVLLETAPRVDAVVVATAAQAEATIWLRDLLAQKNDLGIFVEIDGGRLWSLDHSGTRGRRLTAAAIAAPDPAAELKTLLILIGDDEAAVTALIDRMAADTFSAGVGFGLAHDGPVPLPDDR